MRVSHVSCTRSVILIVFENLLAVVNQFLNLSVTSYILESRHLIDSIPGCDFTCILNVFTLFDTSFIMKLTRVLQFHGLDSWMHVQETEVGNWPQSQHGVFVQIVLSNKKHASHIHHYLIMDHIAISKTSTPFTPPSMLVTVKATGIMTCELNETCQATRDHRGIIALGGVRPWQDLNSGDHEKSTHNQPRHPTWAVKVHGARLPYMRFPQDNWY